MSAEKKILRLLIVDDSPDDAELAADVLRAGGYMLKNQRVQDLPRIQAALAKGPWDVVIAEHALTGLEAPHVLDLVRRAAEDLPLVVFTRKITDAEMLKIMRAGARDVVLKSQPARLLPAVERELRTAREFAEHARIRTAVEEVEDKHRALIEGSREAICYCHDGMHIDANRPYLQLFGYDNLSELEGVPVLNLLDSSCHARVKEWLKQSASGQTPGEPCELLAVRRDGTRLPVEMAVTVVRLRGENCCQIHVTDISRRKAVESKLQFLNRHDPLTGLYNRHYFLQELARAVERARSGSHNSFLLYLDLDDLKGVNDSYGHAAGDRLLLHLAKIVRDKTNERDVVARFGGDEFAVLRSGVERREAEATADALRQAIRETSFSEGGRSLECRCTLVLTPIEAAAESPHKVLSAAYRACDQAKARRHAPLPVERPVAPDDVPEPAVATAEPPAARPEPSAMVQRLRSAIENHGLRLLYQPIINLQAGEEESYEVLVRLASEDGGLVPAAEFIPAAERSGLVRVVDLWVVRRALGVLGELQKQGKRTNFFINLSVASLADDGFIGRIERLLADGPVRPETVVFQIGESVLLEQPVPALTFASAAGALGCRIALDDFGSRLAAVAALRDLPANFLSMDGMFVHRLASDEIHQTVVQTLVHIGHSLDKRVIAKSVQDSDSLALLWRYGVDYVQGNFFQQPDAQLSYAFEDHAVSSDQAVAGWINAGRP
jgi:diguanylate cyclase (GGDEF)-like protein/PAS domain S-box-containing protein